jgi:hypothetical protein
MQWTKEVDNTMAKEVDNTMAKRSRQYNGQKK